MDPRNGEVLTYVSLPGVRPERLCRRHRPRDLGGAQHRSSCGRCRTARFRAAIRRARRSRSSWRRRRSKKGIVTPNTHVNCSGGADVLRPLLSCATERAGTARWTCATRSRSPATCYFYTLGNMLGVDRIYKWAEKLGLAGKTGIDLPNEQESLVPTTEWKMKRFGERWYPGETISVSIGQGQVAVTPASLAVMIATVANGGTRVTPHVVQAPWTRAAAGRWRRRPPWRTRRVPARDAGGAARRPMDGGQRRRHRGPRSHPGRDVSGKTGTAQVISNQGRARARRHRPRPARPRLVRVLRAQGQSRDRRGDLRRAQRAWVPGRADRQARDRDLFRQEGRAAAAAC